MFAMNDVPTVRDAELTLVVTLAKPVIVVLPALIVFVTDSVS